MPKSIPPGNQNLGNNYIGAAQLASAHPEIGVFQKTPLSAK